MKTEKQKGGSRECEETRAPAHAHSTTKPALLNCKTAPDITQPGQRGEDRKEACAKEAPALLGVGEIYRLGDVPCGGLQMAKNFAVYLLLLR